MIALVAAVLASAGVAAAADVSSDVTEVAAPPAFTWTAEDEAALDGGQVVYRYGSWNGADGGLAAIVAHAPIDVVWKHVTDYDAYVTFFPYVTASSTDATEDDGDHDVIDCSMELTTKGIVSRYQVRNVWWPELGFLTFTMLPRGANPLREATGYWRVEPWHGDPSRTIVAYRIDLDAAWYVPGFLKNKAADRGLPTVAKLIAKKAEQDVGTYQPR